MLIQTRQPCKLFFTKSIRLVYFFSRDRLHKNSCKSSPCIFQVSAPFLSIKRFLIISTTFKPFKIITTSTAYNLSLRAVSCDIVPCYQTECRLLQSWTKLVETTFPSIPNKYPLYNKFHVESCCAPLPYPNSNSMLSLRHCKLPRIVSALVELGKQVRRKF